MNKSILALTLLASAGTAMAEEGDLWLTIHVASKHGDDGYYDKRVDWTGHTNNDIAYRDYNESNPGLGLVYELKDNLDLRTGFYKNSVHANSIYAGGSIHTSNTNLFSIGLLLGGVSGYEAMVEMTVAPVVLPYMSINSKYVRAEISYMPEVSHYDSVVGLTIAVTF